MAISNSNASSQNMERFQITGHLHFVKLKMQIKDLKCLEAPCVSQITKGEQRTGSRRERRAGERERPRSGLLREEVGICPQ